jgi:hypothetical protein
MIDTARNSQFLMANLGAEVSRLISAKESGEKEMVKGALERSYHILDQILMLKDMEPRIEELLLLRSVIEDTANDKPTLAIEPEHLERYFIPFTARFVS